MAMTMRGFHSQVSLRLRQSAGPGSVVVFFRGLFPPAGPALLYINAYSLVGLHPERRH
jgi:hypothetical protein